MRFQTIGIALACSLLIALIGGVGGAFLLTPVRAGTPSPWLHVADLAPLPEDGTPVLVAVAKPMYDAWTRLPDRVLGSIYLRRSLPTDEIIALSTWNEWGARVEYDSEKRIFRDRRCWSGRFTADGRNLDIGPQHDLVRFDVRVIGQNVYINCKHPAWGE